MNIFVILGCILLIVISIIILIVIHKTARKEYDDIEEGHIIVIYGNMFSSSEKYDFVIKRENDVLYTQHNGKFTFNDYMNGKIK